MKQTNILSLRIVLAALLLMLNFRLSADTQVTQLRTLGLDNPIGIESTPSFSWKISSTERNFVQSAYEIEVSEVGGTSVWSSGKVSSSRQTEVLYEGQALQSRTAYQWTIKVYDQQNACISSEAATFETGILQQSEWAQAKWIQPQASPYNAIVEIYPNEENVSARYVKINVSKSGPHAADDPNFGFVQIAEIEIYDENGNNVAHSATFTATNEWTGMQGYGWSLAYINDGNILSGTNGFTTKQNLTTTVITADLKQNYHISRIVLYPRQTSPAVGDATQAANFPSTYSIQTSSDQSSWATQYSVTDAPAPRYETSLNIPYIGRNFTMNSEKTVESARLYASALGIFTMTLNGHPVTPNVLEPGESAYDKHILYNTYDVTSLVQEGVNTILAQVAGGLVNMSKMSDRFVKPELANNTGSTSLRAMLYVRYTDGTEECIPTTSDWGSRKSPTTGSNWYGGEDYDARIPRLSTQSYVDCTAWPKVNEVANPIFCAPSASSANLAIGNMRAREYEPLRVVETWKAVKVVQNSKGNYLVDFGQNFAGTYRFALSAPAGTKITLYDSELQEGNACKFEYMYETGGTTNKTLDTYTFAGEGTEEWGPEFMYHGFRYLEISGLPTAPSPENFTAMRIRGNMAQSGQFTTSNTLLNDIHTICDHGIQSQLYNTVTDCPHREKLGWLDVPNMMYSTLTYNYDAKGLLSKQVMDAFDSQGANGYVPSTVPHFMRVYDDDLNWGGAAITIPYRNFKQYGDKVLMQKYYNEMRNLINYYTSRTSNHIIVNEMSVLSDWGQETSGLTNHTTSSFTLTCTYYYLLNIMSEMATELGQEADAQTWQQLAVQVKNAFNDRFYKNGVYEYGNQANYGMALFYGLVEEENVADCARRLAESVKESNYAIKTGEIGLRPTLMALAQNGYNDVVYRMAKKTDYPSYGYWVANGATTSMEYWDMSLSQNHCMMDHIEEWFYSELGGIRNTGKGFETFRVQPWIPSDMAQCDVRYESPRGMVRMAYNRGTSNTTYNISVPANATATIVLPVAKGFKLYENGTEVSNVIYADTLATVVCGSGDYVFTMNASTLDELVPAATDVQWDGELTDKVQNASFEQMNKGTAPWTPTNWNVAFPDGGGYGSGLTFDQRNVRPTDGTYDWHIWYNAAYVSVRMYQTLTLEPGQYVLTGDIRCVDNVAITGKQRLFATIGDAVIDEGTIYSLPYNHDGSVNINNSDNENAGNWRTLSLTFTLTETSTVTIGYDCPKADGGPQKGGFQTDNVRLYRHIDELTVPAHGYSTYVNKDHAYQMPNGMEGLVVRTYEETDGGYALGNKVIYKSGSLVPAGQPLIVHRLTKSTEPTHHYLMGVRHEANLVADNLLHGDYDEQDGQWLTSYSDDIDAYYYKLSTQQGSNLGFYWGAENGGQFLMPSPHRAYLVIPTNIASQVRSFLINESETTALPSHIGTASMLHNKYLKDGRIVIAKSGHLYNTNGQLLK